MKFDPGKLAKDAMQGLKKDEEKSGAAADAAKNLLHGAKDAVGGVPAQLVESLRKLIEEAKRLLEATGGKNRVLAEGISRAQSLLDSGNLSLDGVTKMVAELGGLLKNAGSGKQEAEAESRPEPAGAAAPKAGPPKPAAAPSAPAAAPGKTIRFSDVKEGAYYYDAVQWAVSHEVVMGTSETTFSPDQNCTRGQAVLIIWRAEGSPAPKSQKNPFTDVAKNAYYYDAALWAAERGIVTGSTLLPDDVVTRGQMVTFLYRNAGSPAVRGESTFTDVPKDAYFAPAVAWATGKKITSGTGEHSFSPDAGCTRGQIVTFLYKAKA